MYKRGDAPDERYHRRAHDDALNGPRAKLDDGFHAVTHKSPISVQRLAQAAGSAARRDTAYDFNSFAASKKNSDEFETVALICTKDGRVVGLLVSRERESKHTTNLDSFQADGFDSWRPIEATEIGTHRRRAIDMIWVLKKNRKQRVAKGLANALSVYFKMEIKEFAHMTPFRQDAVALWKALGQSTIYVV
jgi:hypothetical protein